MGAARGRPGGAPLAWVWGLRGRALSQPRPLVLSGVWPGPTTHWLWVRGVRAGGTVTDPTARALVSWLRALWGQHEGARGGGASCLHLGRPQWALSHPQPTVLSGLRPGPTTHWLWVRGLRAWGLVTSSTARTLACWLGALWKRHEGDGGGAPLAWVRGVRGQALSHPRPLVLSGVRPGPTTHWLWVRGVRAWGPVTNATGRAFASWPCALWGRHEGARGGRLLPRRWASGVGCSPTPDHSSFRSCGLGPLPTGSGCGGCGRGDSHQCHSARSCELALRAAGAAGGRPGGAPLAWVCSARGRPLSHPRPLVLSGVRPGPTTHWPRVRCACMGARLSLAPSPVPRFVVCCARLLGPRHPAAVVARHLSSCRGCGQRRASLACLVALRWCAGRLSHRRRAFSHPGGCRLRLYWVAARGTWRPADNRALCACRWLLPRQGRWARSASYPFGAPRWGFPWRGPLA